MRVNKPAINVYKSQNLNSKIVTQLIYGDTFKKLKKNGSWIEIKNDLDGYRGNIKLKKFGSNQKYSHKVHCLYSKLYSKPELNSQIKKKLSFGSRIKITKKKGIFYKFDNFWIKKNDLKKISFKSKNIFNNIKQFKNTKYKWGGKHFEGIDCSALVQLFFNFNNKYCPRDSKDQIKYFKKKTSLNNIKRGDLIFWKGHVAIALSRKKLIHAYGPSKKTVIMPIKQTIERIYKTANLRVIGIRKIK